MTSSHELLLLPEVAEKLRVTIATLRDWRARGIGPPSAKVGRHVMYRVVDVDEWLNAKFAAKSEGGK